jgi:hypothetical protein
MHMGMGNSTQRGGGLQNSRALLVVTVGFFWRSGESDVGRQSMLLSRTQMVVTCVLLTRVQNAPLIAGAAMVLLAHASFRARMLQGISFAPALDACYTCGEDGSLHLSKNYGNMHMRGQKAQKRRVCVENNLVRLKGTLSETDEHDKRCRWRCVQEEWQVCRVEEGNGGLLIIRDDKKDQPHKVRAQPMRISL